MSNVGEEHYCVWRLPDGSCDGSGLLDDEERAARVTAVPAAAARAA